MDVHAPIVGTVVAVLIDPAETRQWIISMLRTAPAPRWRQQTHRTRVDPV